MEYGVFSDEGMVEGGFVDEASARAAMDRYGGAEDRFGVFECCHDHPEHARDHCEECFGDGEGA